MAKTPNQVYDEALTALGAVGAGQTASAEDVLVASTAFRPMLEELAAADVCYVAVDADDDDAEDVPDEYYLPLSKLLANEIAPHFGAGYDEALREVLLRRLRRLRHSPGYGSTQQAEYY
jgi:hypothetical protein